MLFDPQGFHSLLSYSIQDRQSRGSIPHSELGLPRAIFNQENAKCPRPQAILVGALSQLRFPFSNRLTFVQKGHLWESKRLSGENANEKSVVLFWVLIFINKMDWGGSLRAFLLASGRKGARLTICRPL